MSVRFVSGYMTAGRRSAFWAPAFLLLLCLAALAVLWRAMVETEENRLELSTDITAEQVQLRIEAWIDDRAAILAHFAQKWPDLYLNERESFTTEAQGFLDLYPGFQALNFIDRDWVIRIVVPLQGNQPALCQDLHDHPFAGVPDAMELAAETGETVRTTLIELLQGGMGFATYSPIFDLDGSLGGFINGVFRVSGLIDNCLAEENLRRRFCYALIAENGRPAYAHNWDGIGQQAQYLKEREVRIVDKIWTLRMVPSQEEILANSTAADEILVAGGVVLALVMALLLRVLMQRQVELKLSRGKYRLLVENQADLVVKLDTDARILFASPSYCRFTGRSEADLLDRSIFEFIHRDDVGTVESQLTGLLETPGNEQFEMRGIDTTGYCWLSINASTITDAGGAVEGLVCVARDITRRRELENQLIKSQKLQAIGLLAGGIAHDFNNIIQAVQGYMGFVKAELTPGTRPYSDMEEAEVAANRAAVLTRQLLAFSRRQAMMPMNLDLNDVIVDTLSMLDRLIGESIRLEFSSEQDLKLACADRGQIEQVLVNLCLNARDAIRRDGSITITTANITLDDAFCSLHAWAQPGEYVRLSVADTGVGMDEDLQKQIFDPFFTTKDTGNGTGLGLSTVYGIVQQHDGLVQVESVPGEGTTMSVYLPCAEGVKTVPESKDQPVYRQGRETILVAEDEDMVRNLAVRILEKAGYTVLEAADGLQADALIEERVDEIDLVFMDVMMPGMTGHEVSDRIRKAHPGIRILLTTGYDSELDSRTPGEDGTHKILPKPYGRSLLLQTVRDALDAPA